MKVEVAGERYFTVLRQSLLSAEVPGRYTHKTTSTCSRSIVTKKLQYRIPYLFEQQLWLQLISRRLIECDEIRHVLLGERNRLGVQNVDQKVAVLEANHCDCL